MPRHGIGLRSCAPRGSFRRTRRCRGSCDTGILRAWSRCSTHRRAGCNVGGLASAASAAGFKIDKGYGDLKGKAFRIGHMGDHTLSRLQQLLAAITA
jgi:hypothetical protein